MGENMTRIAIADDDAGMRLVMRKIIERQEGYELVGDFDSGSALLEAFDSIRPEVCVLDVEMPGLTGIECARQIQDTNPMTVLIFATAHEEYMGDAFSVYAFDYLLKPFKVERVQKTLGRVRERLCQGRSPGGAGVAAHAPRVKPGRIMLKHREGVSFLSADDILLVQREQRATVIYTRDGGRYVTGDTLSDMEARLDPEVFFRCHKSYIVNLNHIDNITPYGRWTYIIQLKGIEQDALITHEKFEELENMFS